ncbi:outer dynein arm protein (macronuclear) [Tetrahymena thermophila SB210]|uniref:Outer dynein arm protein n=1 Tax=Tetrahymena thermophila (strain SB210) TaxID=312017 RepID=I7LT66_TETTS|nr:outer dynein arm protein [Tetrahymena thermophila SB210]EAR84486.1 outer dynein arm protein [Tetrahymena thermophila SB210]|eukprot:XP_001032149.1 outer dynein arm protein [Tetrahymena thermophila SB210]
MYTGYQGYNNHSTKSLNYSIASAAGRSLLSEPHIVTLQKEVDNYTRRVEHEKRRLFSLEETYNMVKREHQQKKEKITELKQKQNNTSTKLIEAKIKNLRARIEQAQAKYNETQAENQKLKEQINSLRKERVLHLDVCRKLGEEVEKASKLTREIIDQNEEKINKTNIIQSEIIMLRNKNEEEKKTYMKQFDIVQKKAEEEKPKHEILKASKKENFETMDTQNLLKHRLKKIIANNKEKVRVIEQYQKNLRVIDEAFQQIKEGSGITDIDEITNTFIKSEEQNYSLYNYVDILSQDIDNLESINRDLENKCIEQEIENESRKRALMGTPHDEKIKKKLNGLLQKKEEEINQVRNIIKDLKPHLQNSLVELAKTQFKQDPKKQFDYELGFDLTENNLEQYLADVEYYANILIAYKSMNNDNNDLSKSLLIDQIPPKDFKTQTQNPNQDQQIQNLEDQVNLDNKELYNHDKFKDAAIEAIEKKKNKVNLSNY